MRVEFRCKRCGRDIQANFTRAGKLAQCKGCNFTQEIPDPSAGAPDEGSRGGTKRHEEPDIPAPPQQRQAAPAKKKSGGGGGADAVIKKVIVLVILVIVAFVAYKILQGRGLI